ncbi:LexA family transcriptional regulator [Methylosinus sp. Ce-a6]|uniref:LexA family transcriptional regulator n=1 Tax=Methylosinus sp. Ce-a6 TaxID=2172005 RepID=UPI00135AD725|nr:LexA family transcriptional regulator [Methylosinus sp. Ce-a6]
MDTLANRLKQRRKQLRLSQAAVARAVAKLRGRAFSQQAYAALESGDSQSSAEIATIAEVLKAPLAWLRDGKGSSPEAVEPPCFESAVDADLGRDKDEGTILEAEVRAGAGGGGVPAGAYYVSDGDGNSYHAEGIRDRWVIPQAVVREMLHASPTHVRIFEVIGDSMINPDSRAFSLYPGDRVFADLRDTIPSPEGIFVLWDGLSVVVKRVEVVRGADPIRLRLISANPQYSPYEATTDEVRIIGRYVGRFTVF